MSSELLSDSNRVALAVLQVTGYVLNALRPEAEHPSIALRVAGGRDGEFAVNGRGVRVARRRFRGTPDYTTKALRCCTHLRTGLSRPLSCSARS